MIQAETVLTPRSSSSAGASSGWRFDNTYSRLPAAFFERVAPTPVRAPALVLWNTALAQRLGLGAAVFEGAPGASLFAGNVLPPGAEPIAQAYAGHQFGHFTMLGDGRAILLGEQLAPDGERFDVQLKGAGPTPFSRRGDGRAALGPMLREYILSEAMAALGIPTTRSLAVVTTGEPVYRETVLRGAVLTRVARSHLRVGTFEYAAAKRDVALLRALADHAIVRHAPAARSAENVYLGLLDAVIARQAALVAQWLLVGFIHGVMNTDNMSVAGETIDYGPCAFIDAYEPTTVFSSIDHQGRYAFGNQPRIAQWNLMRLAEALLPLLHEAEAEAITLAEASLGRFPALFDGHWLLGMRRKLGLFGAEDGDQALADSLLGWMRTERVDYTQTLRALAEAEGPVGELFAQPSFQQWYGAWQARLGRQAEPREAALRLMRASNPAIIPRNHRVEEALAAATERGDLSVAQRLLAALARPYDDAAEHLDYRTPPPPSTLAYQTFCGT